MNQPMWNRELVGEATHFAAKARKIKAAKRLLTGRALDRRLKQIEAESVMGWHDDGRPRDGSLES